MSHDNEKNERMSLADFVDRIGFGADVEEVPAEEHAQLRGAAMALGARGFSGEAEEIRALRSPVEITVLVVALRLRVKQLLEENRPLLELSRSGATRALVGVLSSARGEASALLQAIANLDPGPERQELESRVGGYADEIGRWMPNADSVTVEDTVRIRETKRLAELAKESERGRQSRGSKHGSFRSSAVEDEAAPPRTLMLTSVFILLCLVFLAFSPGRLSGKVDPAVQALTEVIRQELPVLDRVLPADRSLLLVVDDRWASESEAQRRAQVSRLLDRGLGEYDELIVTSESGQLLSFWSKQPGGSWIPDQ